MAGRCRAFKYQLQPTVKQTYALERLVVGQRELYNAALEERRGAWRWERRSVTRYDQYRTLTALREVRPDTLAFGVTVCRGTLARSDLAFAAFFRRVRAGQTPGFPRFKGAGRFDSVSWPDVSGWKIVEPQHRLYLQGVGQVRYRQNRPVRGTPKTITVRREGRRWFVTVFCVDVPAQPLPETGQVTGIDVGIAHLATLSDGTTIPNPRPGRHDERRLATAQQELATRKRGSIRLVTTQAAGTVTSVRSTSSTSTWLPKRSRLVRSADRSADRASIALTSMAAIRPEGNTSTTQRYVFIALIPISLTRFKDRRSCVGA